MKDGWQYKVKAECFEIGGDGYIATRWYRSIDEMQEVLLAMLCQSPRAWRVVVGHPVLEEGKQINPNTVQREYTCWPGMEYICTYRAVAPRRTSAQQAKYTKHVTEVEYGRI